MLYFLLLSLNPTKTLAWVVPLSIINPESLKLVCMTLEPLFNPIMLSDKSTFTEFITTLVELPSILKFPNIVVSPWMNKLFKESVVLNELLIMLIALDKEISPEILWLISVETPLDKEISQEILSLISVERPVDK